jgi:putative DNA primase/helicase
MIPQQLQHPEFRFIKINPNDLKAPYEPGWTTTQNYTHEDPKIQEWISKGQNYGVATGFGDLIVIDCDNQQLQKWVDENLPKTFAVKTGGGGTHNYYICPNQEKIILENGKGHLGEIQSKGQQVIGPGSTHKTGKKYKIIHNMPITKIKKQKIQEKIPKEWIKGKPQKTQTNTNKTKLIHNLNITDIIPLGGLTKKPNGEYQGPHPIHGSKTGNNFTLDPNKGVWNCFRHKGGGDVLTYIGVEEGIINCGESLDTTTFKKVIQIARDKYGLKTKQDVEEEEIIHNKDYTRLKLEVISLLSQRKPNRAKATELIVQVIEGENRFYTIRDDDKSEIWCYHDGIYIPNGATIIKERCRDILGQHNTASFANQVIFKIETDTYIEQSEFFDNNIVEEIVCENGILNLVTKELKPFTEDKIFFTKIPVTYDPEKQCPNIIQFLKDVLKTEEDLPIMQELFGYLLWKEYNIEKAVMMIGTGRNGKGKTISLMKKFIGPQNCSSVPLQNLETDTFSKCSLHKKLANLAGDIDERALKHTGSFKNLTGRDIISADRKFKTRIHFENYAKMVFAANQLPRTKDLSEGFFMRWVLLEFPYKFVKEAVYESVTDVLEKQYLKIRDPDIINKIATEEELSGLLNWALVGLARLQKQKDFSYSKSTDDVKRMWLRKSDSFTAFCMDNLEEKYGNEIPKSEIRHCYNEYCKRHKLRPVSDLQIKRILTTMFAVYETKPVLDFDRVHMWNGIDWQVQLSLQNSLKK